MPFLPRALPATLFCPSARVPGGYIVFQNGFVKEVVNVTAADLQPDELTFVKAHLQDWEPPIRPCEPPEATAWDACLQTGEQIKRNPNLAPQPSEAPQLEERPEDPRMRIEEAREEIVDEEEELGARGCSAHLARTDWTGAAARPVQWSHQAQEANQSNGYKRVCRNKR